MTAAPHTPPYDRNRIREDRPFEGLSSSATSTRGAAARSSGYYICALVGFRLD
jgi:hypothetical protein